MTPSLSKLSFITSSGRLDLVWQTLYNIRYRLLWYKLIKRISFGHLDSSMRSVYVRKRLLRLKFCNVTLQTRVDFDIFPSLSMTKFALLATIIEMLLCIYFMYVFPLFCWYPCTQCVSTEHSATKAHADHKSKIFNLNPPTIKGSVELEGSKVRVLRRLLFMLFISRFTATTAHVWNYFIF